MLLVLGWGAAPLAGGMLLGEVARASPGSFSDGKAASLVAFFTGCEGARVGASPAAGGD
jgi:hypothetical protein